MKLKGTAFLFVLMAAMAYWSVAIRIQSNAQPNTKEYSQVYARQCLTSMDPVIQSAGIEPDLCISSYDVEGVWIASWGTWYELDEINLYIDDINYLYSFWAEY